MNIIFENEKYLLFTVTAGYTFVLQFKTGDAKDKICKTIEEAEKTTKMKMWDGKYSTHKRFP